MSHPEKTKKSRDQGNDYHIPNQYNLLMQAPVAIAVFRGRDYIIEMANDRMLELWDTTRAEVWNKPLFETNPELRTQGFDQLMQQVINDGKGIIIPEIPLTLKRKDGDVTIYLKLAYEPLREADNRITGILAMAHEITEQVAGRKKVEASEKRFRDMILQSPNAIAILTGKDLVVEIANSIMLERLFHKTAEEVSGQKLLDIFPELEGQRYPALLRQVFESGVRYRESESEIEILENGELKKYYLDLEYAPFTDSDNKITGVLVTAFDITQRVLDRRMLEESEQRSRLAIEATEMGTFDWDLKTQEFRYSDRMKGIFGGTPGRNFDHNDLVNLIHPDDLPIRNQSVQNCFVSGSLKYQVRLIWPDKSVHWVSVYGKIFYDHNHEPVKMYGTALDISRERNYQRALEESEEKFRSLANFIPTFVWTTDKNGRLTYFNHAITEFSGLSEEEIRHGGWFQLLHPEDRAVSIRRLEKAIQSGTDFQAELRFRNKSGEYRWQMGRSVALKNDDGEIQMWIGTSTDIHDQKMMAEELEKRVARRTAELKQANEELIRANQDLEQFAYVSSHDLQEPLRKILTFSDMVLKKINHDQQDVIIHLGKINTSAARMSVLITDLLNYSKVSKADDKYVSIDLNSVLDDIKNDFE
ncbi:MAG: PAS domain S-box protein, partial [Chitinophagaceae bacterium]